MWLSRINIPFYSAGHEGLAKLSYSPKDTPIFEGRPVRLQSHFPSFHYCVTPSVCPLWVAVGDTKVNMRWSPLQSNIPPGEMRHTPAKLKYKKECGQWHAAGVLWQEYSGKALLRWYWGEQRTRMFIFLNKDGGCCGEKMLWTKREKVWPAATSSRWSGCWL